LEKPRARSTSLPAVAECYAEQALAKLVSKELHKLAGYSLRVTHRPARGGHDRVIVKTLRAASSEKIVVFIDYEEEHASRSYTEQLCSNKPETIYQARGTALIVCHTRKKPRKKETKKNIDIYAVIWKPRSEEVLSAIAGISRDPETRKRIKNDPSYVERLLAKTELPARTAAALHRLLLQGNARCRQ